MGCIRITAGNGKQAETEKVNFCMYEKIAIISKQFHDISTFCPKDQQDVGPPDCT
jgi:hypothetical protein